MHQKFKVGEIVVIREDLPKATIPPGLGKYLGEDVEIVRVAQQNELPQRDKDGIGYGVIHADGTKFMAMQHALRPKKRPGEYDGNEAGSWDQITNYTGWKLPVKKKATA